MTTSKVRNISGWILTGLITLFFCTQSIPLKFNPAMAEMFQGLGIDNNARFYIGLLEIVCLVLFIIPRTGIFGTLLLAAYMGGAIVIHLCHGDSFLFQAIVASFIWITAFVRFPELSNRILTGK
jgi:hypothetical protein